jgi:hypothetical protein
MFKALLGVRGVPPACSRLLAKSCWRRRHFFMTSDTLPASHARVFIRWTAHGTSEARKWIGGYARWSHITRAHTAKPN